MCFGENKFSLKHLRASQKAHKGLDAVDLHLWCKKHWEVIYIIPSEGFGSDFVLVLKLFGLFSCPTVAILTHVLLSRYNKHSP